MNELLAICIPTYNRSLILKENLDNLISNYGIMNVNIYISDNASTDDTECVVKEAREKYPNIIYSKASENAGSSVNIERVLSMTQGENYAWLLGDDDTITGDISVIIEALKKQPLAVFLGNNENVSEGLYDGKSLLYDVRRELSFMSAWIISKEVLDAAEFDRYRDTWFIHTGVVLDKSLISGRKVQYLHNCWVKQEIGEGVRYRELGSREFEVWREGYAKLITLLPIIPWKEKLEFIRAEGESKYRHDIVLLLNSKKNGYYTRQTREEYMRIFKLYHRKGGAIAALIVDLSPIRLINTLRPLYRKLRAKG